jgi:hypothetical protein
MEKTCTKCGEIKGLELFKINSGHKDGRTSWCRSCYRIHISSQPIRERTREYLKSWKRDFTLKNPGLFTEKERRRRKNNPAKYHLSAMYGFLKRGSRSEIARATFHAVSLGILSRGPCLICGSQKVVGHHRDYSWPLWISWICLFHHNGLHALTRRGVIYEDAIYSLTSNHIINHHFI